MWLTYYLGETYSAICSYHELKNRKKKENKKLRKYILQEQVRESNGEIYFDEKEPGKFYMNWKFCNNNEGERELCI